MENQEVKHYQVNGKYRVVFEKAASANKIDGFKIEVNADSKAEAMAEAYELYEWAIGRVEITKPFQSTITKEIKS